MGRYAVMTVEPPNVSVWLEYNDNTLRIQRAGWNNPTEQGIRVRIWENDVLRYDSVLVGTGTQNVPGNYQLEPAIDPEFPDAEPGLRLPDGITMRMEWPS